MIGAKFRAVLRVALTVAAALVLLLAATPAADGEIAVPPVRDIEISKVGFRLDLRMYNPVSAADAARHARVLRSAIEDQQPGVGSVDMGCGAVFSPADENGRARLERFCDLKQLRWTYRISSQVRAIIVGPVAETGSELPSRRTC